MSYYQVVLKGKDFTFKHEGTPTSGGFVTVRWVKAKDEEEAELKAVDLVKQDQSLINITLTNRDSDLPLIYLHELEKVSLLNYLKFKPGKGYTFQYDEGY